MSNRQLPPNPPGCRTLTDPEVVRLRSRDDKLWSDPRKTCLTCSKEEHDGVATFSTRDEDGAVVVYDCPCVEQWKLSRWLLNSGVDLRYQRFSWLDTENVSVSAQTAVLGYMDASHSRINAGDGLTLWSTGTGTGKTLLATLLIKGLLAKGHDGYFTQFNDMLTQFTAGWRNEEESAWFVKRIRNAGVLVVDDMGRESKGRENITESMFDTVIRSRNAACKPTFITTNYTPDQMRQGYGGNVLSLLSEVNDVIEVAGPDYRPTASAQRAKDRADGVVFPIVAQ